MSVAVLNLNSNLISKNLFFDDCFVSAGKTIKGTTALNIECQGGTINIGEANDTVNLKGTVNNINATNLAIQDKLIQINSNASGAGTCRAAGVNFRDNDVDNQGYIKTSNDGQYLTIKAPENNYVLSTPNLTANAILLTDQSDVLTSGSVIPRNNVAVDGNAKGYFIINDAATGALSSVEMIDRQKIAVTVANTVCINNANGEFTSSQYLPKEMGGLYQDISAVADGFLKFDNGSLISTADVLDSNSNLAVGKISEFTTISNSKYLYKDASGNLVGDDGPSMTIADGSITNAKIASDAAILRNKINVSTAGKGKFLINDQTTGALADSSLLSYAASSLSMVLPDTGIFSVSAYKYIFNSLKTEELLINQTTNATPLLMKSEQLANNRSFIIKFKIIGRDTGNNYHNIYSGMFNCRNRGLGQPIVISDIFNTFSDVDNNLIDCAVSVQSNAWVDGYNIIVTGKTSTNINWCLHIKKLQSY